MTGILRRLTWVFLIIKFICVTCEITLDPDPWRRGNAANLTCETSQFARISKDGIEVTTCFVSTDCDISPDPSTDYDLYYTVSATGNNVTINVANVSKGRDDGDWECQTSAGKFIKTTNVTDAPEVTSPSQTSSSTTSLTTNTYTGVPSPPRNFNSSNITSDSVTLEWDTPFDNGGSPLTGYVIEAKDSKSNDWYIVADIGADVNRYVVGNLKPEETYYFRISATNALGRSEPATLDTPVTLPPKGTPGPGPLLCIPIVTICGVLVIIGCIVFLGYYRNWCCFGKNEKTDEIIKIFVMVVIMVIVIIDVVVVFIYCNSTVVRIFAVAWVVIWSIVCLCWLCLRKKVPDPPRNFRCTKKPCDSVTLEWAAPSYHCLLPLNGYVIEFRDRKSKDWKEKNINAGVNLDDVKNLKPEETYYFRISAINIVGRSEPATLDTHVKPGAAGTIETSLTNPPSGNNTNANNSGPQR